MKTLVAVLMFVGFASMFATGLTLDRKMGIVIVMASTGWVTRLIERNNRNALC